MQWFKKLVKNIKAQIKWWRMTPAERDLHSVIIVDRNAAMAAVYARSALSSAEYFARRVQLEALQLDSDEQLLQDFSEAPHFLYRDHDQGESPWLH